jgi:hypothetical protein
MDTTHTMDTKTPIFVLIVTFVPIVIGAPGARDQ